jgi:putative nucleotidyltransferase with HDIG domain
MQTKRSVLTMDAAADSRFKAAESIVTKGIHSVITAPLISMDRPKGVIYAARRSMTEQFTDDDLELVSAVAMMAGVAIEGMEVRENQKATLMETVKTLVAAVELRDPSSKGHSDRVSKICGAIATEMKLSVEKNERVQLAGLLHDIGKVAISETGLHNVGQKTDGVRGGKDSHHVLLGKEIISNMPELSDIAEAVETHHEAFGGGGFPKGLQGEKIPVMGRIIAVADGFDHLLARSGIRGENVPVKGALMQIGQQSAKRYDPDVVRALLIAHRNGSLFSPEKKTPVAQ